MLDFRSCRYWILGALRRECAKRVVELILPAVGSVGTLAGWHSRCWAAEALNDYSAGCLFQPVVRYYLDLRSRDGVNVRFGEQYASSHFVPSLGPLAKDGVCWASWASCLFAAWSISSGLASFNNASDVTFKVCLRGVYSDCVVVCKFSVFVANALKSRFGSFEPSGTLLALLSANVIDSDERRLYAVGDIRQLKLAWFYSSICDALGKRCGERTLLELAKLGLLKCASFVSLSKLSLFMLSLDLNLMFALTLFNGISEYAKAWLNSKRLRNNLSSLSLEAIGNVRRLDEPVGTESDLLSQFSFEFGNAGLSKLEQSLSSSSSLLLLLSLLLSLSLLLLLLLLLLLAPRCCWNVFKDCSNAMLKLVMLAEAGTRSLTRGEVALGSLDRIWSRSWVLTAVQSVWKCVVGTLWLEPVLAFWFQVVGLILSVLLGPSLIKKC